MPVIVNNTLDLQSIQCHMIGLERLINMCYTSRMHRPSWYVPREIKLTGTRIDLEYLGSYYYNGCDHDVDTADIEFKGCLLLGHVLVCSQKFSWCVIDGKPAIVRDNRFCVLDSRVVRFQFPIEMLEGEDPHFAYYLVRAYEVLSY